MKNIVRYILKQRSKIMLLLIVVSLLMTSSTLAYWSEAVEGTYSNNDYSFVIGEYGTIVNPIFTLSSSSDQGEYIQDNKDFFSNNKGYTHVFEEVFNAEWLYSSSWVNSYLIEGDIEFDYEIEIHKQNGKEITGKKYDRYMEYINVEFNDDNDSKIVLNEDPATFGFTYSITEPTNSNHYKQLDDLIITITITYTIDNVTYTYIS